MTTLGLIDTAIGGKGAIDLPGVGRNLLGVVHQPTATILDIGLVEDEPATERRAALAEAVKYGLIGDDGLLSLLESGARRAPDSMWPSGAALLEPSSVAPLRSVTACSSTNGTYPESGWR